MGQKALQQLKADLLSVVVPNVCLRCVCCGQKISSRPSSGDVSEAVPSRKTMFAPASPLQGPFFRFQNLSREAGTRVFGTRSNSKVKRALVNERSGSPTIAAHTKTSPTN